MTGVRQASSVSHAFRSDATRSHQRSRLVLLRENLSRLRPLPCSVRFRFVDARGAPVAAHGSVGICCRKPRVRMTMAKRLGWSLASIFSRTRVGFLTALLATACGGSDLGAVDPPENPASSDQQATAEDGLADGFNTFKQTFVNFGFDLRFPIGYAFHPGLSTEKLTGGGHPPKGSAIFDFAAQRVNATLSNVPPGVNFDLWLSHNNARSGRTVRPENRDHFLKGGGFAPASINSPCFDPRGLHPAGAPGTHLNFDPANGLL